jgi:hypothetical protein
LNLIGQLATVFDSARQLLPSTVEVVPGDRGCLFLFFGRDFSPVLEEARVGDL